MKILNLLFTSLIIGIFAYGTSNAQSKGIPLEKSISLKGTGFTQSRLDSLTDYLKNNLSTTAMMILKDGKIIYEYGDISKVSYIASCRKSILGILYGKYVENGIIDLTWITKLLQK